MSCTVGVLGAGNMGTAMAQVAADNRHQVRIWTVEQTIYDDIHSNHRNSRYVGDTILKNNIQPTLRLSDATAAAELVLICVPSHAVRQVGRQAAEWLDQGQLILNAAKGIEEKSYLLMSQVLTQELPQSARGSIASMGGPAIAKEVAQGLPTAVAIGATNLDLAQRARRLLENDYFKVEPTTDIAGVELGSALKNVYAIILGMADGINLGTNTKAIIGTIGFQEMESIACAFGARSETIRSLAGLGDLFTTGYNEGSRNRTLGERLAAKSGWQDYLATNTVEGVATVRTVKEMTGALAISTPLLDMLFSVLFEGSEPAVTLRNFLLGHTFA